MTISYYNGGSSISGIPNRNYFLEGSKLDASSTKPLLFMPCDVEDLIDYRHKTYSLRMTGFTDAGFKLCIIVENIDVFFDVRCPKDEHIDKFAYNIMNTMDMNELIYRKIDTIEAYPLFGFHERPIPYKRVYTTDLQTRRKAIELIRQKGYETANDDLSCYYRKVARDYHLPISNWLVIKQHRLKVNGGLATTYVDINNITPYNGELTGNLKRERCLVMTWDIETYSSSNTGDVPKPERSTDYIFMICCSFHWAMDSCDTEPLYKVCIVDKEIVDQEGVHTIICKEEINIIKAFGLLVKAMLPDILIGFNDHDYDWNFLIERAHQCGLLKELYNNMSIIPNTFASDDYVYNRLVMKKNIKISPEETMFCRFVKPVGLIPIDIRVCFKKLYKKEEITKGSSLNFYLKLNKLDQKVDLPHTEMFKIYEEGDAEKLSLVRHYCVIDSVSCFRLFSKQLIMSTLRENATLSYISIFDENFYAVSMKIANKIIAEGLHRNILCSNITKEKTLTDKFSGAHVFDPEKGLEDKRPVIPEDFKSLYPSIIMAYNLSPETFVSTERYAEELHSKGRSTYALEFDYANERKYAWFVRHDQMEERWGLIPSILKDLFSGRVAIQKAQKTIDKSTSDGDFEYNRLEIKQKAIKVFMNSIYGVSGMDINPLFLLEQAVAITSTGKRLINTVAEFVRGKGYFVKYGDSVADYTPVIIRHQDTIDIVTIDSLSSKYGTNEWIPCVDDEEKEVCILENIEVWSDSGFTNVNHVIRHKLHESKKMVRILTHTGVIDTTDDHSLLTSEGERISPKDLNVGDEILHYDLPAIQTDYHDISVSEARIMGFFFGDGSCGSYECKSGKKNSWALNNSDMQLLEYYKGLCEEVYPDFNWVIMDTIDTSNVYKLSPRNVEYGSIAQFVRNYRSLLYSDKAKVIPNNIMRSSFAVRKAFWDGMYDADGDKDPHFIRIDQKNQISAAFITMLATSIGYKVSLNTRKDKQDIYRMTCTKQKQRKNPNVIKKISEIDYSGYVYDLTTSNHHFAAGIGRIVAHNTDSVYLKPPSRYFTELDKQYNNGEMDKQEYWTRMVEISDGLSEDIRDQINVYLEELVGNTYIKMENEEVKFPVIFTGKKKYAGIAHYHDKTGKLVVDFYPKKLFIRGIDIIKEGQPMLAITIGNKILRNILDVYKPPESTVLGIVETVFNDAIENTNQWTIDDFIQSDAYRPLKENIKVKTFVERMRKRHELQVAENKKRIESGEQPEEYIYEPPSPGERFKYVIVKQTQFYDIRGKKINLGKGDLMEFVHVVKKLGLEIDIGQYLKSKVAGICARFINYHPKFQPTEGQRTMKEIDEYCQKMAKKFLEAIVDQYMLPKIDHNKCKRAYKAVKKSVDQQLGKLGSQSAELFGRFEELDEIDTESVRKTLNDLAKDSLRTKQADIERRNKEMLKLLNISEKTGTDIDGTTSKNLFKNYKIIDLIIERNHRVIDKVYEAMNLYDLTQLIKKYNTNFEQLVLHTRELDDVSDLRIGGLLDESDHKILEVFKDQFNILVCEVECLISNMKLKEILGSLRTKRFNKRY